MLSVFSWALKKKHVLPRAGQIALNAFFAIRGACMYGSCRNFASSPKIRSAYFYLKTPTSIGRTILDLDGPRARFLPSARARIARSDFFWHILDQTPQTEVHTKNQLPRYSGSGRIELTRTADRQTTDDRNRCF